MVCQMLRVVSWNLRGLVTMVVGIHKLGLSHANNDFNRSQPRIIGAVRVTSWVPLLGGKETNTNGSTHAWTSKWQFPVEVSSSIFLRVIEVLGLRWGVQPINQTRRTGTAPIIIQWRAKVESAQMQNEIDLGSAIMHCRLHFTYFWVHHIIHHHHHHPRPRPRHRHRHRHHHCHHQ